MTHRFLLFLFSLSLSVMPASAENSTVAGEQYDLLIWGATPSGITAALTADELGLRTVLLSETQHVGGMMSSGLAASDHCNKKVVGGFARSFFKRLGEHYGKRIVWRFEPHVAEATFENLLAGSSVKLLRNQVLQEVALDSSATKVLSIRTGANTLHAASFIDASYAGDLMAKAGVPYTTGRESRDTFGEPDAGVHEIIEKHQLPAGISPYYKNGALLAGVVPTLAPFGSADDKTMAYNFRLCVTTRDSNKVPFPKPENYEASDYEILARAILKRRNMLIKELFEFLSLPNGKYDLNSKGGFSTDYIGGNWEYPDGDFETRQKIVVAHREYTLGLMYFLQTDPRVPGPLRQTANRMGLCKDEFVNNGNWPYELYVRAARRMKGDFVLNQNHMSSDVVHSDPVAVASCPIEARSVQRVVYDGMLVNEGWASKRVESYQLPYRVMLPPQSSVDNLLVTGAVSASHVAFSSLRMEPVFMALGESAAVAISLARSSERGLRNLPAKQLLATLSKRKQRLRPR